MVRGKKKPRDWQKGRVYETENKLIDQMELYGTLQECQLVVDRIVRSKWWLKQFGPRAFGDVRVRDGRGRTSAGAFRHSIKLPRAHRDLITICHELAHVVNIRHGDAWPDHGVTFCQTYLTLVRKWAGKDFEAELRQYFLEGGVKFRGRDRI